VLTGVITQELPRLWRLGGRIRYGTGNAYTPVVNRVLNLDGRTYSPEYGELNGSRVKPFTSVDIRIDKAWEYERWTFSTYLDLQNATNAANVELMSWNFDYSEEDPVTSIPIVPAFGLKGAW
jgi:hypothetical protein